jgi:Fe2+ transport system protein FeoA
MSLNITQINNGKSAKVIELHDNNEIISKLEAMGIVPGAVITKKSAIPAKGPIIIEKDLIQLAIGYNMAKKIIVEPIDIELGSAV